MHSKLPVRWFCTVCTPLIALTLLAMLGCGTGATRADPPAAPQVNLSSTSITFGDQVLNTTSTSKTVTLTNTGTAVLAITSVVAAGDFAQTNTCGTSVAAGGACTISMTFTPPALGTRSGSLTITHNASGSPHHVTLSGSGVSVATPSVVLNPTSLSFGDQTVNTTSASRTITVSNTGSGSLTINSIGITGDYSHSDDCGSSLAAGTHCTVTVTFTPRATGTRNGSVSIVDNASGSPHQAALTGTGVAAAAQLTANPASIAFGNVTVGQSSSRSVTVTAAGATVTISEINITGSDFAVSGASLPITLAIGQSATLTVAFAPLVTGAVTGTAAFVSNAADSPTVALSGTGAATSDQAIIADHNAVGAFGRIPAQWLDAAKRLSVYYGGASHGSQLMYGALALERVNPAYGIAVAQWDLPPAETPSVLRVNYYGMDPTGYWSTTEGLNATRAAARSGLYSHSMFSWCGEMDSNSVQTVQSYLDTLNGLETEFPGMRFVYMTGHAIYVDPWTGEELMRNNQMVRDYVLAHNKVLFDFYDIDTHDPDGNYYPNAQDACTWCASWCSAHPDDCTNLDTAQWPGECAHSHPFQCKLKAQAFWWMMARIAGWDGN